MSWIDQRTRLRNEQSQESGGIQKLLLEQRNGCTDGKESVCSAGDPGLIPGLGKSPGERNGYPLQYSCLKNSMDRGALRATVHRVTESQI